MEDAKRHKKLNPLLNELIRIWVVQKTQAFPLRSLSVYLTGFWKQMQILLLPQAAWERRNAHVAKKERHGVALTLTLNQFGKQKAS